MILQSVLDSLHSSLIWRFREITEARSKSGQIQYWSTDEEERIYLL